MKRRPTKMTSERQNWICEASALIRRVEQARIDISTLFPGQEYLHPFSRVSPSFQMKIAKFLRFNTDKLISYQELKGTLERGKRVGISQGDILFSELKDSFLSSRDIKNSIIKFSELNHKTYAEAKFLFAQILDTGIWLLEAKLIKKMIAVNTKIEEYLLGTYTGSQGDFEKFAQNHADYIDEGFKNDVRSKESKEKRKNSKIPLPVQIAEPRLQPQINKTPLYFPNQRSIDFSQQNQLRQQQQLYTQQQKQYLQRQNQVPGPYKQAPRQQVYYESQNQNVVQNTVQNTAQYQEEVDTYSWAASLGQLMKVRSNSTTTMVNQIKHRLCQIEFKPEFDRLLQILKEGLRYRNSKTPIVSLVLLIQLIFWRREVKTILRSNSFTFHQLQGLASSKPDIQYQKYQGLMPRNAMLPLIKELLDQGRAWSTQCDEVNKQVKSLISKEKSILSSGDTRGLIGGLERKIKRLTDEYNNNVQRFYELRGANKQLQFSDEQIKFAKAVFNLHNKEKIEISYFQKAFDIMKKTIRRSDSKQQLKSKQNQDDSQKQRYQTEFIKEFQHHTRKLVPHLKKLQSFYRVLKDSDKNDASRDKQMRDSPTRYPFYSSKFRRIFRELPKIEDIQSSLSETQKKLFISEMGFKLREYIHQFKEVEDLLMQMKQENITKLPNLEKDALSSLTQQFKSIKNRWQIKTSSSQIKFISYFEWLLEAFGLLLKNSIDIGDVKSLISSSKSFPSHMKLLKETKEKLNVIAGLGDNLKQEVAELMNKSLTEKEIMRGIRSLKDSKVYLPQELKSLKELLRELRVMKGNVENINKKKRNKQKINFIDLLNLQSELNVQRFDLKKEIKIIASLVDTCKEMKNNIQILLDQKDRNSQAIVDQINQYTNSVFYIEDFEEKVIRMNRAINYFKKLPETFSFKHMDLEQLLEFGNSLDDTFDENYINKYTLPLYLAIISILRNLSTLVTIRKRNSRSMTSMNKLQKMLKYFKSLDDDDDGSNNRENHSEAIEWLEDILKKADTHLKNLAELKERGKPKAKTTILFNFLNLKEEYNEINRQGIRQEAAEKNMEIVNLEIPSIKYTADEIKERRKVIIKRLSKVIKKSMQDQTKSSTEIAKYLEKQYHLKFKELDLDCYRALMKKVDRVLNKICKNSFMFDVLTTHCLERNSLSMVLNSDQETITKINSTDQALIYLKLKDDQIDQNEISIHKNEDPSVSKEEIGKRLTPSNDNIEEANVVKKIKLETVEGDEEGEEVVKEKEINEENLGESDEGNMVEEVNDIREIDSSSTLLKKDDDQNMDQEEKEVDQLINEETKSIEDLKEGVKGAEIEVEEQNIEMNAEQKDEQQEQEREQIDIIQEKDDTINQDIIQENEVVEEEEELVQRKLNIDIEMAEENNEQEAEAGEMQEPKTKKQNDTKTNNMKHTSKPRKEIKCIQPINEKIPEPENPSGIWQVYKGQFIFTLADMEIPSISVLTTNLFEKLSCLPALSQSSFNFDSFLKIREFKSKLNNSYPRILSQELTVYTGMLKIRSKYEQSMSLLWSSKGRGNVYQSQVTSNCTIYLLHRDNLQNLSDLDYLPNVELLRGFDTDFFWMIMYSKNQRRMEENNEEDSKDNKMIPAVFKGEIDKRSTEETSHHQKQNNLDDQMEKAMEFNTEIDWMQVGGMEDEENSEIQKQEDLENQDKEADKENQKMRIRNAEMSSSQKVKDSEDLAEMNLLKNKLVQSPQTFIEGLDLSGDILKEKTNQIVIERPLEQGKISIGSDIFESMYQK